MSGSYTEQLNHSSPSSELTSSKILTNRSKDNVLEKIDDLKRSHSRKRFEYERAPVYGEIIEKNGIRERFNGSMFRRMCSKSNCTYHTARLGLCKKHLFETQIQNHPTTPSLTMTFTKALKGEIRMMNNGIKMKFDGKKFRRICSENNCILFISGRYYSSRLCPKHYNQTKSKHPQKLVQSTSTTRTQTQRRRTPALKRTKKHSVMPVNMNDPNLKHPKAGDITDMTDGTRRKYSGGAWRLLCVRQDCPCFAVSRRQCRKHGKEKITKAVISETHQITGNQPLISTSALTVTSTNTSTNSVLHPNKGDIQVLRQMFDGRSWHSLCRNSTCLKRATQNSGFLCAAHLKEARRIVNDDTRIPRRGRKRKMGINTNENDLTEIGYNLRKVQKLRLNGDTVCDQHEFVLSLNTLDEQQSTIRTNSAIDKSKLIEQSAQTDITYPYQTQAETHLVLIDDDDDDDDEQSTLTTAQFPLYLKKEEATDEHLILPSTTTPTIPYYPYPDIQELKPTPDLKSEY